MPTYSEALFEPLEAWIESVLIERNGNDERDAVVELRLVVARMLLEHAGRGATGPIVQPGAIKAEDVDRVIAEAKDLRDSESKS